MKMVAVLVLVMLVSACAAQRFEPTAPPKKTCKVQSNGCCIGQILWCSGGTFHSKFPAVQAARNDPFRKCKCATRGAYRRATGDFRR